MPQTPYPIQAKELRWLYIDFNSYFASVEQQRQPHLRGKPVAILPVETDSTCAIAASYEAKKFGVRICRTSRHQFKRATKVRTNVACDGQN